MESLQLAISGFSLAVVILLAFRYKTQAEISHRLEHQLKRLNTGLDQSLNILHQAREATIRKHQAEIYLLEWKGLKEQELSGTVLEVYLNKYAEYSAAWAELRGLTFAIGDKELINLVNNTPEIREKHNPTETEKAYARTMHEMGVRGYSQQIHTRIAKLIQETLDKQS